ncbi:hypothetical protein CB0940_08171 [Cercospora beticola]|uniref:Uncharacterized protein n=1 Tax=Cercospora beticola TaxID=122368 RepID=A0A2G5HRD5_CERBT|nr:hypothetical protein CB0940_08171 [Cercospora beticola]PIA95104.1 hypothetical protein CB0940_08171 [Cercospora beticola]WPB04738.1 hypothetical protein RHO25_009385 [Cercospora beticola]
MTIKLPPKTNWHFPSSLLHDLNPIPAFILSPSTKAEILACAFEYARSVIPSYTNWRRYLAFMRIIIIGTIAEFKGEMFDLSSYEKDNGGRILYGSYDLDEVLTELFGEGERAEEMAREYKTFLVVTSDKTRSPTTTRNANYNDRRTRFFTTYRSALPVSPSNWFRLRDCDALCRFTVAAALRCNDFEIDGEMAFWFSEEQWRILAEIGVLMYDSVAFYKHRAEGETNNTFAYLDAELRGEVFRVAREGLWGVDQTFTTPVAPMGTEDGLERMQGEKEKVRAWMVVCNMLRFFGGPIHVTMRRYRFVEEGLRIGREEDEAVRWLARKNEKLWWRRKEEGTAGGRTGYEEVDAEMEEGRERFQKYVEKKNELFFDGFAEMMEEGRNRDDDVAGCCVGEGGETARHVFGARILSEAEREVWRQYALGFNDRLKRAFPEVDLDPALPL